MDILLSWEAEQERRPNNSEAFKGKFALGGGMMTS